MASTGLLIELVKRHSILYDTEHPNFKNNRKKDEIWHSIGEKLFSDGDAVKKKWKNIRDTYAKYLKSIKTPAIQKVRKNYRNWHCAKAMEAFDPFLGFPKSESSAKDVNTELDDSLNHFTDNKVFPEDNENSESANIDPPTSQTEVVVPEISSLPTNPRKRRRKEAFEASSPSTSIDCGPRRLNYKRSYTDMDASELIFLGFAKTIKLFSPKRQAITKMKIAQIIMEQEIQHQEEISASLETSTPSRPTSTDSGIRSPYTSSESGNLDMFQSKLLDVDLKKISATTNDVEKFKTEYDDIKVEEEIEVEDFDTEESQTDGVDEKPNTNDEIIYAEVGIRGRHSV